MSDVCIPESGVGRPCTQAGERGPAGAGGAGHRSERGLVTLEWLLIVGAIAGLAASSVLVVQRVLDDTTELPDDPLVRMLEADIAAAYIASDAQARFKEDSSSYTDTEFEARCTGLATTVFNDVVDSSIWERPTASEPALCKLTPKPGLGG